MNTQEAFEAMANRYNLVAMFNELAEIDEKLIYFVRDTFNYAVLMARTERNKKLEEMVYSSEFNADEIINTEIKSDEIAAIHEKFMENLKLFYNANK